MLPTHVGVNRLPMLAHSIYGNAPHARGGEPDLAADIKAKMECSPRTWG